MNKNSQDFFLGARKIIQKPASKSIISSLLSILIGILVGFVVMLIAVTFTPGANPFQALGVIFAGPFAAATPSIAFGNMIFYSVPLIFTGLSVGIAYKTGLFNIGAPGQFHMGTLFSLLIALSIDTNGNRLLGVLVWLLALLAGIAAGMIWGALAGLFKGLFNINEVIVCIMLNWIAANIVTWVFSTTPNLINTAGGKSGYLITTAVTGNYTPKAGLDNIFTYGSSKSYLDFGIILAILAALFVWILLSKTTLGFSLKATGSNRNAAKYAGINDKTRMILSLTIAGGLAAAGGALYYLNPGIEFVWNSAYQILPDWGFNGIAVALLANCNPIGIIFSAIFIRYLSSAGSGLVFAGYNKYFADIIIAVIIYLAGFTRFFKELLGRFEKKKDYWYAKHGLDYMIIKEGDINLEENAKPTSSETTSELQKPKAEVHEEAKKMNPFKKFFLKIKQFFKYYYYKWFKKSKDPMAESLGEKPTEEEQTNEEGGNK